MTYARPRAGLKRMPARWPSLCDRAPAERPRWTRLSIPPDRRHGGEPGRRGARDLGIRNGRHRGHRRPVARGGRQARRLPGPAHPAGRHRHAGAFPRARPRPQGRSGIGLARGRDGRGHGGVRDAEHQPADHDAGGSGRQDRAAAAHRMHCDFAFWVGGTHENVADMPELERLPGAAGIKVFMGSSTGSLLVEDDGASPRSSSAPAAAPPSTPRTSRCCASARACGSRAIRPRTRSGARRRRR